MSGVAIVSAARCERVAWPDVLRAVQSAKARERALVRYRTAGFTPDDFAAKRAAREAMADALTRTEDDLELNPGRDAQATRAAIRAVRRRLEVELWP
jgi:hypothetical protein